LGLKRVLVTGASGFIGQHLIHRLLQEGCSVRALVRSGTSRWSWHQGVEIACGDVQDSVAMRSAVVGCDTVFHLAGKVHALSDILAQESVYYSVNIEGTRNVLEGAMFGGAKRFIFFSSTKAMGEETPVRIDEGSDPNPLTAYGRSKLAAEHLVFDYGKRSSLHTVCLRLPLVYGVGNKGNPLRMIAAIDRGIFPPLPDVGNRRSMIHVSNVVDAALLAAIHPAANGQCYIVTDKTHYSTRELYEAICKALGRRVPRSYLPIGVLKALGYLGDAVGYMRGRRFFFDSTALEKLMGSAWYSSDKIARELGYRPSITFQDALPELIAWYRKAQTQVSQGNKEIDSRTCFR
jgi:UDP-glucose 4-epimerase